MGKNLAGVEMGNGRDPHTHTCLRSSSSCSASTISTASFLASSFDIGEAGSQPKAPSSSTRHLSVFKPEEGEGAGGSGKGRAGGGWGGGGSGKGPGGREGRGVGVGGVGGGVGGVGGG